MKKLIIFIVLFYLSSENSKCQKNIHVVRLDSMWQLPYPHNHLATESYIYDALAKSEKYYREIINVWLPEFKSRGNDRDKIHIEFLKILGDNTTEKADTNFINKVNYLLPLSVNKDFPNLTITLFCERAWYYRKTNEHGKSLENLIKAESLSSARPIDHYPHQPYVTFLLNEQFFLYKDYEKVIETGIKLDKNNEKTAQWINTINANMIGLSFLKLNKFDEARLWFQKCLEYSKKRYDNKDEWVGLVAGNHGMAYFKENNFSLAAPYLKSGIEGAFKFNYYNDALLFSSNLCEIYCKNGELNSAEFVFKKIQPYIKEVKNVEILSNYYFSKSLYYKKKNEYKELANIQDSLLKYRLLFQEQRDGNIKTIAEANIELNKSEISLKYKDEELKSQKTKRNLTIGIFILIGTIISLLHHRQKLFTKIKLEQVQNKKNKLEYELQAAKNLLNIFTKNLMEKNAIIENIHSELEKGQNGQKQELDHESFEKLRTSAILTDQDWENFRVLFEKVHTGYLHNLKMKLPDLSPAEIRFMTLAKLELSNKEMGSILGVSVDAVRTIKYRIRKKLNLSEEGGIEDLIKSI